VSFSYPYLGPTSVFGDHTSFGDDFAASINNIEKARSDPVIVSLHPGKSRPMFSSTFCLTAL
jgi:hypothetical protein